PFGAQVDADLPHRLDDGRVEPVRRLAARRAHLDLTARPPGQQRGRHLAPPGVVDADEQDGRGLGAHRSPGSLSRNPAGSSPGRSIPRAPSSPHPPFPSTFIDILTDVSKSVNMSCMRQLIQELEACCAAFRSPPIDQGEAETLAAALRALADPARLRLVSLIAAQPGAEACVCDLTDDLDLSQP